MTNLHEAVILAPSALNRLCRSCHYKNACFQHPIQGANRPSLYGIPAYKVGLVGRPDRFQQRQQNII